jgi:hypothetical protein
VSTALSGPPTDGQGHRGRRWYALEGVPIFPVSKSTPRVDGSNGIKSFFVWRGWSLSWRTVTARCRSKDVHQIRATGSVGTLADRQRGKHAAEDYEPTQPYPPNNDSSLRPGLDRSPAPGVPLRLRRGPLATDAPHPAAHDGERCDSPGAPPTDKKHKGKQGYTSQMLGAPGP